MKGLLGHIPGSIIPGSRRPSRQPSLLETPRSFLTTFLGNATEGHTRRAELIHGSQGGDGEGNPLLDADRGEEVLTLHEPTLCHCPPWRSYEA